MSTLTHERTDLFIGGAGQPSTDQELTPIICPATTEEPFGAAPDWHLHRRRPCDRRGPACPADSTLGRLDWSATRPVDAGAGRRAGRPRRRHGPTGQQ